MKKIEELDRPTSLTIRELDDVVVTLNALIRARNEQIEKADEDWKIRQKLGQVEESKALLVKQEKWVPEQGKDTVIVHGKAYQLASYGPPFPDGSRQATLRLVEDKQ